MDLSNFFNNDGKITDTVYKLYPYFAQGWKNELEYVSDKYHVPEGFSKASLGTIIRSILNLEGDESEIAFLSLFMNDPDYAKRAGAYAFRKYFSDYLNSLYDQRESSRVKGLTTGEYDQKKLREEILKNTYNNIRNEFNYLWSKYSPSSLMEQADIALTNFLRDIFKK